MNLRRIAYVSVLLVFSGIASADPDFPTKEGYFAGYYAGTVGGISVQMDLDLDPTRQAKRLEGWYYYAKYGLPLTLSGTIRESTLVLVETDSDNKETGTFKIKLAFSDTLRGTWSAKGKKSLPVALKRVATTTCISEANRLIECEASFPIFAGKAKPILELNATLRKQAAADLAAFGKVDAEEDESDGLEVVPAILSTRYLVRFWSPSLISLYVDKYEYTGGAHGNTSLRSMNYRLSDDRFRPFALRDIFKDMGKAEKVLVKLVTDDLVRREIGWFKTGAAFPPPKFNFTDFEVFTFDSAGLTIHFPPYAVSCYADGCISVRIPWEQLRPHVLPDGPLGMLAGAR